MTEQKRVPSLRFAEFSEQWELFKLIEVAKIVTGTTPSTFNNEYYENGRFHFVSPADINRNRYISDTKTCLTKLGFSKTRKIKKGSVLFVCIGSTIGKVAQTTERCATNQQINALEANDNSSDDFLFSLLEKKGNRIKLLAGNQAVPQINKTDFSAFKFYFPELEEQQKIASFLSAVDKKIEQLQQKQRLLEAYKKGVMQQLFSQQLRFTQEDGSDYPDWEEKLAKDIFYSHSNKNHNGDLPILSASQELGMIYRNESGIKIQATKKSIKSYKIVEEGDFVITLRSFQGGLDYSDKKGICSPAYTILKPQLPIERNFYKFYFKKERFINRLSNTTVGIRDGKQITYSAFGSLKIPYPCKEEQIQIANFLSAIDQKIAGVQTQIENTQQFKKGLLQQMFI